MDRTMTAAWFKTGEKCSYCGGEIEGIVYEDADGNKWVDVRCDTCDFGGGTSLIDGMDMRMNILTALQISDYYRNNKRG